MSTDLTIAIQSLATPITQLIVVLGSFSIAWMALRVAHDLAKVCLQAGLLPQKPASVPSLPSPKTVPAPTPQQVPSPPLAPATPHPIVDDALTNFVAKQEGFSAKAYWDYKQYTIGYGTKASSASETITEAEAKQRLAAELTSAAHAVSTAIPKAPLGVQQAMTDFSFNLGTGWINEPLGELLKAGNYAEAKNHVLMYNHAGGQVLEALTKRRQAEVSWFDTPL